MNLLIYTGFGNIMSLYKLLWTYPVFPCFKPNLSDDHISTIVKTAGHQNHI